MKHVTILALEHAVSASIVDPRTILSGVNEFLASQDREPAFKIEIAGFSEMVKLNDGVFFVHTDKRLKDIEKTDLVIIPAIGGDLQESIEANKPFIGWIKDQHAKGAEVASLCVGAFILASTGLLNGKECSSHWLTAPLFRELFPEVDLADGRIVTEQNGLYSSGGATSYWNLLLHLVEKYAGRDMAIMASKIYALEIDRKSQSPFVIFQGQKKHEDQAIKNAQDFIESNVYEKISVEELAKRFAIGKRHFERRFKDATNNTPSGYIQRVKVEAAKKLLETSDQNVSQVMYEVGYNDNKAFRNAFKKITGLSPAQYRNKYNKAAAVMTEA